MNSDRPTTPDGKVSTVLRARREQLVAELQEIDRRLSAIVGFNVDPTISIPNRIRLFLTQNGHMKFRAKELAEAVSAPEATIRQALSHLTSCGFVVGGDGTGVYGIDPINGALNEESARFLGGWMDP